MSAIVHWLDSCASTNSELGALPDAPHGYTVACRTQTAGRGQRGNTWEAAPGMNLTFSTLLRPAAIPAARQFELSMLVSMAVANVADRLLEPVGKRAVIKWPNDIYVDNKKICGILIENTLSGASISRAIVGVGLNVNQIRFESDAPNPASISSFTGRSYDLGPLMQRLADEIVGIFSRYEAAPCPDLLTAAYMERLWRGHGEWPFALPDGTRFSAAIERVGSDGLLYLSNGGMYAFKEVQFVL